MLQEWNAIRNVAATPASNQQPGATCIWRKLSAGHVKCNVDASFLPHNKVGIDICIKDDQGVFILAKTEWFSPKSEVHIGEALGLLAALWVHELTLGPVKFELDSKRVIDSFHSSKRDFT
ncbi:cytochrome p450 [Trifolium pratense]|uniref:Cytochrome p450 n=1 Tax=Trifolium pratense TaxID=57577 RepID=A0A2K3NL01_TRIPR|nr:cytochrome p450 [Trifolium pratense]